MPRHWKQLPPGKPYHLVPLDSSTSEYKRVADKFQKTACQKKYNQSTVPPYPQIVEIKRVQNPSLYQKYLQERDALHSKRAAELNAGKGTLEMDLFHGTKADVIEHVINGGFNRIYAGTAVGKLRL